MGRPSAPRALVDRLDPELRALLDPEPTPSWVPPMLATLTERRFSDPAWVFEPKLDGIRCLAFHDGDGVRLLSRNRLPLDRTYPEIAAALLAQPRGGFVIDGEVVAFDGDRPSFGLLQRRSKISDVAKASASPVAVQLHAFDLLHLDGFSVRSLPLVERKALLAEALVFHDPLHLTPHRDTEGEALYREMCDRGWEGVIAKRAASAYVSRRSGDWLKFKCSARQELVIGGFTDPQGSRTGFGALLVGYYEGDELRFAGKVGSGYSNQVLHDLRRQLGALQQRTSPFAPGVPRALARSHWVRPALVAEIEFSEWTADGKLRHPRFLGLRPDKAPDEVRRERPRA